MTICKLKWFLRSEQIYALNNISNFKTKIIYVEDNYTFHNYKKINVETFRYTFILLNTNNADLFLFYCYTY